MTDFKIYLTDNSTVIAYAPNVTAPDDYVYIGTVELELRDLSDLVDWMQMAVDASSIQLTQKFNANFKKPTPNSDLN